MHQWNKKCELLNRYPYGSLQYYVLCAWMWCSDSEILNLYPNRVGYPFIKLTASETRWVKQHLRREIDNVLGREPTNTLGSWPDISSAYVPPWMLPDPLIFSSSLFFTQHSSICISRSDFSQICFAKFWK